MDAAEQVGSIEALASNVKRLDAAFTELESFKESNEITIQRKEIEEYFRKYEQLLKERSDELVGKEKAFELKEFENLALIADRETVVAAKEQTSLDRIQNLKDAAVAAVREKYNPVTLEPVLDDENAEKKVISSFNDDSGVPIVKPLKDETSPTKSEHTVKVQPRMELMQYCKSMDAKGLLSFISTNKKDIDALRVEIPVALKSATEPARLVLDSLEGFYPFDNLGNKEADLAIQGMQRSCVMLLESLAPSLGEGKTLSAEIKNQAKAIADEWKLRLVEVSSDPHSNCLLEVEAFLLLIAIFRIFSEFDQDELCKLIPAVTHRINFPELCRSVGLTDKIPGIIKKLVETGKQINAVHIVQAFNLTDSFPPVPLLQTYLKEVRRTCQGNGRNAVGSASTENDVNSRELSGIRKVVKCVEEYKLQAEYPLEPLLRRLGQLERAKADRKRMGEAVMYPKMKTARINGRYNRPNTDVATVDTMLLPGSVFATVGGSSYTMGTPKRYSHHVGAATNFDYPGTYHQGVSERYPHVEIAMASNYRGPFAKNDYQVTYSQAIPNVPPRSYYYPEDASTTAAPSEVGNASRYAAYLGGLGNGLASCAPYM